MGFKVEFPVSGGDHELDEESKNQDKKYYADHVRGKFYNPQAIVSYPAYISGSPNSRSVNRGLSKL